ncbi:MULTISPECIES: TIGR02611 family protein [Actinoplanes]|uniref:TIGR02611 family protein n=1 Tax=Actinoplanes TaxID=1865 RepID=UPI001FE10980|nr:MULTISPECIES: TIGR02611 family protein [Actinoplanes]
MRVLDRIRTTPTGRLALKIGVGALGGLVTLVGIVLIPLPGPGWAIVILGLAILAVEFHWARGVLAFTRRHVTSWTQWIARQSLPVRGLVGLLGMVFISAVVWASVRVSFGVDLVQVALDFLETRQ